MISNIIWFVMLVSSLSISLGECSDKTSKSKDVLIPKYKIIEVEDISVGSIKRYNVRARVDKVLTIEELGTVSKSIIDMLKTKNPHNALAIFFYLPDSDINGLYTAGKAEWAPSSDWEKAGSVITGNYSTHNLKLSPGNAIGIDTEKMKVPGLSVEIKKKIFFNIVLLQDRLNTNHDDSDKAYKVVAKKFKVKEDIVRNIAMEGLTQGWPMPDGETEGGKTSSGKKQAKNSITQGNETKSAVEYAIEPNDEDKAFAWTVALKAVKERLKAPSTAKFPFSYYGQYIKKVSDRTFVVKSYVDAENSFGAKIRSNFIVKVKRMGGDTYNILDVQIDE